MNKLLQYCSILLLCSIYVSCNNTSSESIEDLQTKFETSALNEPNRITETNKDGNITGDVDNDDWRVGPLFEGIVDIKPPFPNPVLSTDEIAVELNVLVGDKLNGLLVFTGYKSVDSLELVKFVSRKSIPDGLISFAIDPYKITGSRKNVEGIYRIIVKDLDGEFVTYGDIEIKDAQVLFEREAYSLPSNYTATNRNGSVVGGQEDPDDWRVSPYYEGLVYILPPFPNPVLANQRLSFELIVTGIDEVDGIRVHALYNGEDLSPALYQSAHGPIPIGLLSISLNPSELSQLGGDTDRLHRMLVLDSQDNVITYGDIKIN